MREKIDVLVNDIEPNQLGTRRPVAVQSILQGEVARDVGAHVLPRGLAWSMSARDVCNVAWALSTLSPGHVPRDENLESLAEAERRLAPTMTASPSYTSLSSHRSCKGSPDPSSPTTDTTGPDAEYTAHAIFTHCRTLLQTQIKLTLPRLRGQYS